MVPILKPKTLLTLYNVEFSGVPVSDIDPATYEQQLAQKVTDLQVRFQGLTLPPISTFRSAPLNYRMRAEFKIWQASDRAHYAMYRQGEYKKPYTIDSFPAGSCLIEKLMPPLLEQINACEILRSRLFSAEFLTTLSGESLITLLYHRPLDEAWQERATRLSKHMKTDIIGRSRKQKIVIGRDYVIEQLNVAGHSYTYKQVETGFTQPNAKVNEQMLGWAQKHSANFGGDLLELYCGNGNFTAVLAQNFERVLATEISKISVHSATFNFALNNIDNIEVIRLSSEEMTEALNNVRPFRRLNHIDLKSYNFSTVFVDPPRAGLDDGTLELLRRFDNIMYISCNPETLHANLLALSSTHSIEHFAAFDQFPYTPHLEAGAILTKTLKHGSS